MTRDYQSRGYIGGAPVTSTLAGAIGTGDTAFSFNSGGGTGFPTANFWLVLDAGSASVEKVLVGARSGDACSGVVRGVDNTTAKTHAAGTSMIHCGAAQDFTEANALAAALTTKGDSLWKGATLATAPARLAAGANQQIIRYNSANALGVETTFVGSSPVFADIAARNAAITSPTEGMTCATIAEDRVWNYSGSTWMATDWYSRTGTPGFKVRRVAAQAVPTGVMTNISFDTEDRDWEGWGAPTSANWTCPSGQDGIYAMRITGAFGTAPTGGQILGTVNGSTSAVDPAIVGGRPNVASIADTATYVASGAFWLVAGDVVRMGVFHSSGADRNFTGSAELVRLAL